MILPPVDPNLEHQISDKPPLRDDVRLAQGKIAIFQYSAAVIFLFLISGFWRLQVQNPQFYDEKAQANSIKGVIIPAPRGRILDRDGRVIVDNHSSFSLVLAREYLKEDHLRAIAQGLDLDYDDLMNKVRRYRSHPQWDSLPVKEELSPADLAFIDSHHDFFPELVVIRAQRRLYPQNGMMAHVIGYTGEISETELDDPAFAKYDAGAVIGKFGIEREYNDTLMGVDGQRQVVVDNRGQVRDVLNEKPAVAGKDLQLTIDLDLQVVAELAMEGKNGAVVALDPRTGEVLAMVSRPTFDPNKFAVHIKSKDWKEIMDNKDNPMINRAIQAQQAPGSTFKPIVAMAGLESGTIDDTFTVHCPGGATFYGHYYHCHLKGGHGSVGLHKGIVQSCDVFFYNVGNKLGIDKMAFYADLFGYGHLTGIDLPHEKEGVVPSTEWKLRNFRQKWYAGENISVSIGQGALTITPLQLARAYGGFAMDGQWHTPHLTKGGKDTLKQWAFNQKNWTEVVDGTCGVVNEGGTGVRAALPGVTVCGKTGTSQVASNEFTKGKSDKDLKDNAWFVGFAPREHPEIVVAAYYEHGAESKFAAPIVRDVIKAYLDKKVRLTALKQEQQRLASMANFVPPTVGQTVASQPSVAVQSSVASNPEAHP
ncbi:MAG TPA: penicillin-binding protein 2 [Bryobacteraceae bacterium]|nr:penicillin-binding protein 2 [Bryobacteraceae bacterium]